MSGLPRPNASLRHKSVPQRSDCHCGHTFDGRCDGYYRASFEEADELLNECRMERDKLRSAADEDGTTIADLAAAEKQAVDEVTRLRASLFRTLNALDACLLIVRRGPVKEAGVEIAAEARAVLEVGDVF